MCQTGIIYLAFRDSAYLSMTMMSILSLRRSGNRERVTVISDIRPCFWHSQWKLRYTVMPVPRFDSPVFHAVALYKSSILDYTPYQRTLLLDSDTLIVDRLALIWHGKRELALAEDACRTIGCVRSIAPQWASEDSWRRTLDAVGPEGIHYNIGVMRIDKTASMRSLTDCWKSEIHSLKPQDVDQLAMVRALRATRVEVDVLDQAYNTSVKRFHPDQVSVSQPRLLHFNGMNRADTDIEMQHVYSHAFEHACVHRHRR